MVDVSRSLFLVKFCLFVTRTLEKTGLLVFTKFSVESRIKRDQRWKRVNRERNRGNRVFGEVFRPTVINKNE